MKSKKTSKSDHNDLKLKVIAAHLKIIIRDALICLRRIEELTAGILKEQSKSD